MTVDALYYLRTKEQLSALQDLDDVVLTADVAADSGFVVKAGTEGTVVGIWGDGESYEVEFAEPEGTLATVRATGLRRLMQASD